MPLDVGMVSFVALHAERSLRSSQFYSAPHIADNFRLKMTSHFELNTDSLFSGLWGWLSVSSPGNFELILIILSSFSSYLKAYFQICLGRPFFKTVPGDGQGPGNTPAPFRVPGRQPAASSALSTPWGPALCMLEP